MGSPSSGSNLLCNGGKLRVRKEWHSIGEYNRELYLDAIETAIERGLHQKFVAYHADIKSDAQAHETCAFFLWHRRFTISYENMLRSLGPRFACLTIPYWDIMRDYQKQQQKTCDSYTSCSDIVTDFGGVAESDDFYYRKYSGNEADGHLHTKTPIQNLRDDENRVGIIRYDMWFDPIPSSAAIDQVMDVFRTSGGNQMQFWEKLQNGIHDEVHDTIGGNMRSPSSPIDPLFFPWHSTIDLFGYLWEICHTDSLGGANASFSLGLNNRSCSYSTDAESFFPNLDISSSEIYLKRGSTDIRDDPMIGQYFDDDLGLNFTNLANVRRLDEHNSYIYSQLLQLELRKLLVNDTSVCPGALYLLELEENYTAQADNSFDDKSRRPPSFSMAVLLQIRQNWTEQAHEYWSTLYPNQPEKVNCNMQFLDCLLEVMDHDTIERWAIDDAFLEQVVRKEHVNHPSCDFHKNPKRNNATSIPTTFNDSNKDNPAASFVDVMQQPSSLLLPMTILIISVFL